MKAMNSTWHHVSVDIETYSDVDIKKAGLYKYIESPAFDILLIAYAVNNGPVEIIDLAKDENPEPFIQAIYDPEVVLHSYNAAFEHAALNEWLRRKSYWNGHPLATIPVTAWRCTMRTDSTAGIPRVWPPPARPWACPRTSRRWASARR